MSWGRPAGIATTAWLNVNGTAQAAPGLIKNSEAVGRRFVPIPTTANALSIRPKPDLFDSGD